MRREFQGFFRDYSKSPVENRYGIDDFGSGARLYTRNRFNATRDSMNQRFGWVVKSIVGRTRSVKRTAPAA